MVYWVGPTTSRLYHFPPRKTEGGRGRYRIGSLFFTPLLRDVQEEILPTSFLSAGGSNFLIGQYPRSSCHFLFARCRLLALKPCIRFVRSA